MRSLIFRTVAKFITPFLLTLSAFLLIRGHDEPGGGFAGGLVGATALAVNMFAFGEKAMRRMLRVDPRTLAGIGLCCSIGAGFIPLFFNEPFLKSLWLEIPTPLGLAKIGTVLLFDLGVYLVVVGVVVSFLEDMGPE